MKEILHEKVLQKSGLRFWKKVVRSLCIAGVIIMGLLSIIATGGSGGGSSGSISGSGK